LKRVVVLYSSPPASERTRRQSSAGKAARVDRADDALLADHPHLRVPGTSIEAFEALYMPGM
jgi:hypothetical protein